jgi:hypothetical protein
MGCCFTKQKISDDTFELYKYLFKQDKYYLFDILQKCPEQYYKILCKAEELNYDLRPYINDTTYYNTWYSNHLFCLSYCVGDLKYKPDMNSSFYGMNTNISQELGIQILDKLIELDVNIYAINYYRYNILYSIKNAGLTQRINNEKFIKKLEDYYYKNNQNYQTNNQKYQKLNQHDDFTKY